MDNSLKAKWISALKSGTYKRCMLRLRNNRNEFCPQGVLLDLYDPNGWTKEGVQMWKDCYYYGIRFGSISTDILDKIGLDMNVCIEIQIMNDSESKDKGKKYEFTWDEIADYIERNA